ncbi:MAG TPA: aromatic ring-hydroxylating dioxygenase subunit alpha [Anaerolineae bacterium]
MTDIAYTLPGRYFTSATIFEQELEHIFYESWLCVGRTEQIARPGDYFLHQVGDESIIVLRDTAGMPRAFYNVCRHRGTQLCQEQQGRFSKSIQCPYHAWTYALDGRLIGVPSLENMGYLNKEDYPLHAVALKTWQGFLFISLSRQPEPFESAFAPILERLHPWRVADLQTVERIEYDVQANWKLIAENYNECYHCPVIHSRLNELSNYRSGQNILTQGPILGGYMGLAPGEGSMSQSGRMCAPPLGEVAGEDLNRIYYFALFPNMLLSLHPDYVMFHTLWPKSVDHTRVVCAWLFDPAALSDPHVDPGDAVEFWDTTNREDWHVCESSQRGVRSRAYTPGPYYQWQEQLLPEFDRQVLLALGHSLEEQGSRGVEEQGR